MQLGPYHKRQLEREPAEPEPEIDHEREARIEAEARHVTAPEGDR